MEDRDKPVLTAGILVVTAIGLGAALVGGNERTIEVGLLASVAGLVSVLIWLAVRRNE
ncbi:MAG: hypothetical protein ABSA11_10510 [Candidatus Bathyarchaeia archaeon]|jgi:hypothetical protein